MNLHLYGGIIFYAKKYDTMRLKKISCMGSCWPIQLITVISLYMINDITQPLLSNDDQEFQDHDMYDGQSSQLTSLIFP